MTRKQAKAAIRRMVGQRKAEAGSLRAYECPRCPGWYHVGHKKHWSKIRPETWEAIRQ